MIMVEVAFVWCLEAYVEKVQKESSNKSNKILYIKAKFKITEKESMLKLSSYFTLIHNGDYVLIFKKMCCHEIGHHVKYLK